MGLAFANSPEKLVLHHGQGVSGRCIVRIVPQKLAAQTKLTAEQLVVDYGDADTQIGHLYVHTVPGFSISGLTLDRARWLAADSRVVYVGEGLASDLIAGVDWGTGYVVRQRKRRPYPALVNMGVGIFGRRGPSGSPLSFLDDAIRSSIAKNITYVVAAGNMGSGEGSTCLDISPARVWEAITVGATRIGDGVDSVPQFSSRGSCVDIHAPGVEILSAWHRSTLPETPRFFRAPR